MNERVRFMTAPTEEGKNLRKIMRMELEKVYMKYEYTDPKRDEESSKIMRKWYRGE